MTAQNGFKNIVRLSCFVDSLAAMVGQHVAGLLPTSCDRKGMASAWVARATPRGITIGGEQGSYLSGACQR